MTFHQKAPTPPQIVRFTTANKAPTLNISCIAPHRCQRQQIAKLRMLCASCMPPHTSPPDPGNTGGRYSHISTEHEDGGTERLHDAKQQTALSLHCCCQAFNSQNPLLS